VTDIIPWDRLRVLPAVAADPMRIRQTAQRARRRLTGWSRPDQWVYARDVENALRGEPEQTVVLSNDPELAVHLRRRLPRLRIIHWFHNLELAADGFRRRYAADSGIVSMAVSAYLARAVEQTYRMTPGRVHVNLNGVDAAAFPDSARPERSPVVGFLGRVAVETGVDVLIDAALLLSDRGHRFSLQIVGDTNWGEHNTNPYVEGVQRRIAELRGRGVDVRATGHVSRANLPAALAATDVHVLPSRWDEPCSLALLEGMASGLPVVASATGGSPELVGGAGALVPREDPAALARALEPLIGDRELRRDRGERAATRAQELSWDATWGRLRDLIDGDGS
jgi:glycosyltransferase involved in cell wall biosynthesis